MSLSLFQLFKIGIGPSSSHTMGPMKAANEFNLLLKNKLLIEHVDTIHCNLYGSLSLTGKGHKTDVAVLLGLSGEIPEQVDADQVHEIVSQIEKTGLLHLAKQKTITFSPEKNIVFNENFLDFHPNGIKFAAYDGNGTCLLEETYFSVGGGFIINEKNQNDGNHNFQHAPIPYPFATAEELLQQADSHQLTFAELIIENEQAITGDSKAKIKNKLLHIWDVMLHSIERGCNQVGLLPGDLKVKRRAHDMYMQLINSKNTNTLAAMDWLNVFAIAVNEENADGGRIVTAPTNGAAGVIPAVLAYYQKFYPDCNDDKICAFLATAACIGMLYKQNASISAAEVGCQGEIGVACSMAAAALTAVLGDNNQQVQNAAEIGMEHNLGLTCDPISGLVQIPCIERNTMGAVKAVNACQLALKRADKQCVSLDQVIKTMYQTGLDMQSKYKETSQGGLAVNYTAC